MEFVPGKLNTYSIALEKMLKKMNFNYLGFNILFSYIE